MGGPRSITLPESAATTTSRSFSIRRVLNFGVSAVLFLVTLPVFAIVALLVRMTSHGPVFHREAAIGRRGKTVELLTFRTNVDGGGTDAHARLRAVVGRTEAWSPIGRQLSKLRLDRLPRLLNVLKGDTSLF